MHPTKYNCRICGSEMYTDTNSLGPAVAVCSKCGYKRHGWIRGNPNGSHYFKARQGQPPGLPTTTIRVPVAMVAEIRELVAKRKNGV